MRALQTAGNSKKQTIANSFSCQRYHLHVKTARLMMGRKRRKGGILSIDCTYRATVVRSGHPNVLIEVKLIPSGDPTTASSQEAPPPTMEIEHPVHSPPPCSSASPFSGEDNDIVERSYTERQRRLTEAWAAVREQLLSRWSPSMPCHQVKCAV